MKKLITALITCFVYLSVPAQIGTTYDELSLELEYITSRIDLLITSKYSNLKEYKESDAARESQAISYRNIINSIKNAEVEDPDISNFVAYYFDSDNVKYDVYGDNSLIIIDWVELEKILKIKIKNLEL